MKTVFGYKHTALISLSISAISLILFFILIGYPNSIYILFSTAVFLLFGVFELLVYRYRYDENVIVLIIFFKKIKINKSDIKEIYCGQNFGVNVSTYSFVINLDGVVERSCSSVFDYCSACRKLNMKNIYFRNIASKKDFAEIFGSHPDLIIRYGN